MPRRALVTISSVIAPLFDCYAGRGLPTRRFGFHGRSDWHDRETVESNHDLVSLNVRLRIHGTPETTRASDACRWSGWARHVPRRRCDRESPPKPPSWSPTPDSAPPGGPKPAQSPVGTRTPAHGGGVRSTTSEPMGVNDGISIQQVRLGRIKLADWSPPGVLGTPRPVARGRFVVRYRCSVRRDGRQPVSSESHIRDRPLHRRRW